MKFVKEIIRPGRYHTKNKTGESQVHQITPERIEHWNDTFHRMRGQNLRVPAPFRHDQNATPLRFSGDQQDVDSYNNGGFWETTWVDPTTKRLYGLVDVPNPEKAQKIVDGEIAHVSLLAKDTWLDPKTNEEYEDALTHIAFVTHPVAADQEEFQPVDAAAFSLSEHPETDTKFSALFNDESVTDSNEKPTGDGTTANLKSVITLLAKLPTPVALPSDTNESNFVERLVVALLAVSSANEDQSDNVTKEPEGADEKPAPIAMSKELEFAVSVLASSEIVNPKTNAPFTVADLSSVEPKKEVQLSAEQQASLNFAQKTVRDSYIDRIKACVTQGKIAPATAKELATPLLQNLDVAFSADGAIVKGPIDYVLEAWEKIPQGSVLTGKAPTRAKQREDAGIFGNETAFSFAEGLEEPEPILDFESQGEDGFEISDEESEQVAEAILSRFK